MLALMLQPLKDAFILALHDAFYPVFCNSGVLSFRTPPDAAGACNRTDPRERQVLAVATGNPPEKLRGPLDNEFIWTLVWLQRKRLFVAGRLSLLAPAKGH